MANFVNRTEELSRLRTLYESKDAELAVIFGRRRLGKTALVTESLGRETDAVVYQAKQKTSAWFFSICFTHRPGPGLRM